MIEILALAAGYTPAARPNFEFIMPTSLLNLHVFNNMVDIIRPLGYNITTLYRHDFMSELSSLFLPTNNAYTIFKTKVMLSTIGRRN